MTQQGFISISILLFSTLISSCLYLTVVISLNYTQVVKDQEQALFHYSQALSGLRYAHQYFDLVPYTNKSSLTLNDISSFTAIQIHSIQFIVLKNDSYVYSLSYHGEFSRILRCSYRFKDDTLVFNDLRYFFEE